MHAIVRKGNGEFYISAVFGYYSDSHAPYNYGSYFIVFDENKEHLIKQQTFDPNKKPVLDLMILVVDPDESGWLKDEHGFGGLDFLPKDEVMKIINEGICPDEILSKCRELDGRYHYSEYHDILDDNDILCLMTVSGWFHDAFIDEFEVKEDSVRVMFGGIWGCKIEMFFEGDVTYDTECRDPVKHDPNWYGSTMIRQDGYIYFVDEYDMTVEDIKEGFCWFKSKKIRYRIIPK